MPKKQSKHKSFKYKYKKYKAKYLKQLSQIHKQLSSHPPSIISKIKAFLYGSCVGDALGSRYEFLDSDQATKLVTQDSTNSSQLNILGGGPFKTHPGQISDDTEMMLCLLRSIATSSQPPTYSQSTTADYYIEWFSTNPIDVGKTISRSLFTRQKSLTAQDMINNSSELNNTSLSNGTLMRIAPLAILALSLKDSQLKKIVDQECDLTHPNIIIKDACFIFCLAIKYSLLNFTKKQIFKLILNKSREPRVKIIIRDSIDTPEPTYLIDDLLKESYINSDSKRYQGYFGISLQNALYEFFNGDDFDNSLINIIKRGGDVDTNCAIAGALLGAFYDINKINTEWLNTIKTADYERRKKYINYDVNIIDKYVNKLFS